MVVVFLTLPAYYFQGYLDRGEGDAPARVFFYKCQYISGKLDYSAYDYMWVTGEELLSYLDPELGQVRLLSP